MSDTKRYILFSGEDYYPLGGWKDFVGVYETIDEATKAGESLSNNWWEVVDIQAMQVIKSGPNSQRGLAARLQERAEK